MRALELDYRRKPASASWAGVALLLAGLACASGIGLQYRHVAAELAQAEADLRAAEPAARRKSAPRPSGDVQKVSIELKHANEILLRLKSPWNELFASVEAAKLPNVALLAIESDTEKGRMKISGEAKDLEGMLDYLRYLGTQPTLADVYLQSHQVQQQDPQRPVRFVLSADWTARR